MLAVVSDCGTRLPDHEVLQQLLLYMETIPTGPLRLQCGCVGAICTSHHYFSDMEMRSGVGPRGANPETTLAFMVRHGHKITLEHCQASKMQQTKHTR